MLPIRIANFLNAGDAVVVDISAVPASRMNFKIALLLSLYIGTSVADDGVAHKPVWQTAACIRVTLSAADKLNLPIRHEIQYLVQSEAGEKFYSKTISASGPSFDDTQVVFPDDFFWKAKQGQQMQAYVDCFKGANYSWQIVVDKKLIDRGTFSFRRP